jgi:FAD/FMN-containing dehydrogenase
VKPESPPDPARRELTQLALLGVGVSGLSGCRTSAPTRPLIENITGLYPVRVARMARPANTEEVRRVLGEWPGRVSLGGARCSMGGQIALRDSLHLDLRDMNRLLWLKPAEKSVRVQAGMCWRELQGLIDPHGLAVRTMQTYANFTVGGSVSVNVHGRYVGHGPIIHSVRALQLVLADGRLVEASRAENPDLFRAAIGGYGAPGVVTEVELGLDENTRIERGVERVSLPDYPAWFAEQVGADPTVLLHNVDLYPPAFDAADAITWRRSERPLTIGQRLQPDHAKYLGDRSTIWAISSLPGGNALRREIITPALLKGPAVVWRNYEASYDIRMLEPFTRFMSTYALAEYFIPVANFAAFAAILRRTLRQRDAEALNVSIRHAPADAESVMAWAREDVFCFVVYYKQRVLSESLRHVGEWTRELIDAALDCGGSYYLPYQLHATRAQFERAYPQRGEFLAIRQRYDPGQRFSNEMWRKYLDV